MTIIRMQNWVKYNNRQSVSLYDLWFRQFLRMQNLSAEWNKAKRLWFSIKELLFTDRMTRIVRIPLVDQTMDWPFAKPANSARTNGRWLSNCWIIAVAKTTKDLSECRITVMTFGSAISARRFLTNVIYHENELFIILSALPLFGKSAGSRCKRRKTLPYNLFGQETS